MRARITLTALFLAGMLVCFGAAQAQVTTEVRTGTVVSVDGNNLVVRFSTGELKTFDVPEDFRFDVDGKQLSVHELKPGTALSRTITTSTDPKTVYTTTERSGTVWFVQGNTLIVTGADRKNRQYIVPNWQKFKVNGQDMTVDQLKKGMVLTATIVHENQSTVVTTTAGGVSGSAPADTSTSMSSSTSSSTTSSTPPPSSSQSTPDKPTLPKTGSPLALIGILGMGFLAFSFGLRKFRK